MYFTHMQWLPYINGGGTVDSYDRAHERRYIALALELADTPIPGYPTGFAEWQRRFRINWNIEAPEAPPFTAEQAEFALANIELAIRNREWDKFKHLCLSKWTRPWEVVPELKQFKAPKGDYGVGIEIEMGFNSDKDATFFCEYMKDWKNVTFDREGGKYPIETTFPPTIYSEINSRYLPFRYLRYLTKNKDRVYKHDETAAVGTHINVSKGGITNYNPNGRLTDLNNCLKNIIKNNDLNIKYFGRRPYGLAFNQGKWVEFKLFNSQLSDKRLRQYIDIAVSLIDLVVGKTDTPMTLQNVHIALEEGFCKSLKTKPVVDPKDTEGLETMPRVQSYAPHYIIPPVAEAA